MASTLVREKITGVATAGLTAALVAMSACSSPSLFGQDAGKPTPDSSAPNDASPMSATYCGRGVDVIDVVPPAGFCLKHYAQVDEPRAMVVADNGDVLVAAPSRGTPGGASGGKGAILILTDDDHDGLATSSVFLDGLEDVHGLALGGGFLYFTRQETVFKLPFTAGQRVANGTPTDLKLPATFAGGGRWTHGLAISKSGQLYASRGEYGTCGASHGGEISSVGAGGALTTLASGLRNPMYMNCHYADDTCAAMELGDDLHEGAREKMILLRPDTNFGFPCCYTTKKPEMTGAACDDVTTEDAFFELTETPFGFDWERGLWPEPFKGGIFVALHGSAYSSPEWQGARVVYAPTSPTSHAPTQDWTTFLSGFGPGGSVLDRPADVKFGPDGRLFIADDASDHVYWMAPTTLAAPTN
ncbi:MAG TPA: hypothetical protein VHJ20_20795 [Polyangia bacterium]|nr:hypothetical protein [Polyangia bacterium]